MGIGSGTFGGAGGANCSGVLVDSLIVLNTGGFGPGVNGRGPGGALLTLGTLRHCTIADNVGTPGGVVNYDATGSVLYSIVWGNRLPSTAPSNVQTVGNFGTTYFASCIDSGVAGTTSNGVIVSDPLFVAPPTNYRLQASSPCRDNAPFHAFSFGQTAPDLERRPRLRGSARDRGAYEFGPPIDEHLGTIEDLRLETTVNGGGNANDWERNATAGRVLAVNMTTPLGTFGPEYPVLGAEATMTGITSSFPQYPELHIGPSSMILFAGIASGVPLGNGVLFSAPVPMSLAGSGVTIRFQGIVVSPSALNGVFALTVAQDVVIL